LAKIVSRRAFTQHLEERIAADRGLGIGLGDLTELHTNVALARIARTVSESMRTLVLSLGATSSSIACMIEGTPAITITLWIQKPGAPDTLLRTRSEPLGIRVMRRRAWLRRSSSPRHRA
jgi:hypothetical protein